MLDAVAGGGEKKSPWEYETGIMQKLIDNIAILNNAKINCSKAIHPQWTWEMKLYNQSRFEAFVNCVHSRTRRHWMHTNKFHIGKKKQRERHQKTMWKFTSEIWNIWWYFSWSRTLTLHSLLTASSAYNNNKIPLCFLFFILNNLRTWHSWIGVKCAF